MLLETPLTSVLRLRKDEKRHHMIRNLKAGIALALAFISVSAFALPAPPPIKIVVLSRDADTRALVLAYLAYLEEKGEIRSETFYLNSSDFAACKEGEGYETACVKQVLNEAQFPGAGVAIIVTGSSGAQRWLCAGTGQGWRNRAQQDVEVDLRAALFATGEERLAATNAAYGCLVSAAAESGW